MSVITIKTILNNFENFVGREISIMGRIIRYKSQGNRIFGSICDGSEATNLQFIHEFEDDKSVFHEDITPGCSVVLYGTIVDSPSKGQDIEIVIKDCKLISLVRDPKTYPYGAEMTKRGKKVTSLTHKERLITVRSDTYGRFRETKLQAIFRIRSTLKMALYKFFESKQFIQVDTPLITKSDCEGAGEMFQVTTLDLDKIDSSEDKYKDDFFGCKANLTVSGQLEAEALAQTLGRVFTFGPTFRAENSNTSRHLSEFWMLEPEMVFDDECERTRYHKLMQLEEDMIKFVIREVLEKSIGDIVYLENTISPGLRDKLNSILEIDEFPKISYTDVILELKKCKPDKFEQNVIEWGMDLHSEHERYICETLYSSPVFITDYPKSLKSFYMKENDDKLTCQAVDLIVPGIGELCGGSMREDDPDKLVSTMNEKGVPTSDLQWYIDLRYDGGLPTGGFGIGFERLIRLVTEADSIRDVIAFSRYAGHI